MDHRPRSPSDPPETDRAVDPDVDAFRSAASEATASRRLHAMLVDRVMPLVRDVVRQRMRDGVDRQEHDDLCHDVVLQILATLQRLRAGPAEAPIADLAAYTTVVAGRACNACLRRKFPERSRLKNRIRYALTHHPAFRLIDDGRGHWSCGLSSWRSPWTGSGNERLQDLRMGSRSGLAFAFGDDDPAGLTVIDLVERLLRFIGGPVELDDLVSCAAGLRRITDRPLTPDQSDSPNAAGWWESIADTSRPLPERLADDALLAAVWAEVQQLPVKQRAALLLNLRDHEGREMTSLLPLVGIASLARVAACLEVTVAELATIWPRLPLDDLTIAQRLGVTRQHVITLRKSAKDRLATR